jgi:hypothetical protein
MTAYDEKVKTDGTNGIFAARATAPSLPQSALEHVVNPVFAGKTCLANSAPIAPTARSPRFSNSLAEAKGDKVPRTLAFALRLV